MEVRREWGHNPVKYDDENESQYEDRPKSYTQSELDRKRADFVEGGDFSDDVVVEHELSSYDEEARFEDLAVAQTPGDDRDEDDKENSHSLVSRFQEFLEPEIATEEAFEENKEDEIWGLNHINREKMARRNKRAKLSKQAEEAAESEIAENGGNMCFVGGQLYNLFADE